MALRPNIGIYTQPISFIGLPVVAAPVPLTPLPIAVQIIAAPWREDVALQVPMRWNRCASPSRSRRSGNRISSGMSGRLVNLFQGAASSRRASPCRVVATRSPRAAHEMELASAFSVATVRAIRRRLRKRAPAAGARPSDERRSYVRGWPTSAYASPPSADPPRRTLEFVREEMRAFIHARAAAFPRSLGRFGAIYAACAPRPVGHDVRSGARASRTAAPVSRSAGALTDQARRVVVRFTTVRERAVNAMRSHIATVSRSMRPGPWPARDSCASRRAWKCPGRR